MAKKTRTVEASAAPPVTEVAPESPSDGATTPDLVERRAAYNRLVRKAQFQDIKLIGMKYFLKPQYHLTPTKEHQRRVDGELMSVSDADDEGVRVGQIKWTVLVMHTRRNLARFEAIYIVVYSGMNGSSDETVSTFMESIGMAASYSYFRAVCAQLDWAGGLRLPPLPMQQFTPNL